MFYSFKIEVRVLKIFILFFHRKKHTCTLQGFRESWVSVTRVS